MKDNLQNKAIQGLTNKEVLSSRKQYGQNVLTPPQKTSVIKLYVEKFNDPIIKILLIAVLVSFILAFIENNFVETIGIFFAIMLATTIGFYFELDAARKFEVLNAIEEEQKVKVRRNGVVVEVMRKDVVVGDTIIVETGDEVPADAILVEAIDLQVNESSLTGETLTSKYVDQEKGKANEAYPCNVLLRSSMVMNGRAVAIVTAVGDNTEIGKVTKKSTEVSNVQTPLSLQLSKLAKLISKIGTSVAVITFFVFLIHDIFINPLWHTNNYFGMTEVVLHYFMFSITLIVMAVPEGLPMAVTLALALNMRRMLKSNNLVRKLHATETMGAVTVICTDKTGTLTQNKMQVQELKQYCNNTELLVEAIAANTTANLNITSSENKQNKNENIEGIGNPTEVALLLWCYEHNYNYAHYRLEEKTLHQLPFSTERKFMATIAEVENKYYLFIKGAPEVVLGYCKIDEHEKQSVVKSLKEYQNKAMRTLALGYRELTLSDLEMQANLFDCNHCLSGITLQAVVAISDPIRECVPSSVKQCKEAGINIKMVTGDTSATVIEIARQIGIWNDQNVSPQTVEQWHITGTDFENLNDDEALKRVASLKVMSRARPTDKQRLVELLQKRGEVVAVTGDGTNDAPALNYAHVGLSLGSGTSVAKEASDMTLIDDSFISIVQAVMWGRSLYKNIQKFLYFQLVVNLTALLLVLGGAIIGTYMPLTITQILWVNLIMDTFAAMALASLPPSREVLKDKPRKQTEFLINPSMLKNIIITGGLFFVFLISLLYYYNESATNGISTHRLTIFFTIFVMLQIWNLFNAKALGDNTSALKKLRKNRAFVFVLIIVLAGQWLIVTFGGKMFRTQPLTIAEWVAIIVGTSVVLWFAELKRLWRK